MATRAWSVPRGHCSSTDCREASEVSFVITAQRPCTCGCPFTGFPHRNEGTAAEMMKSPGPGLGSWETSQQPG